MYENCTGHEVEKRSGYNKALRRVKNIYIYIDMVCAVPSTKPYFLGLQKIFKINKKIKTSRK